MKENKYKKELCYSYENSKRIIEREEELKGIMGMAMYEFDVTQKQLTKDINKALYDFAEKTGMSLYELCFTTKPSIQQKVSYDNSSPITLMKNIEYEITLNPINFELEKGGGYWKEKYYNLKAKMQELIDSKNE